MTDCEKKEVIQGIRNEYMGLKDAPRESLANSVRALADDLYSRETHFIFELIQNAEDNCYVEDVRPSLRFALREIDDGGRLRACLVVENNETGFEEKHVRALCRVGSSTKGKDDGYIGEKGIGFKSVFRVTDCPQIHSNGFHFRLPEKDVDSGLGYIVPEWTTSALAELPQDWTTILLPLKDGVSPKDVARSLQDIPPETILFLTRLDAIEVCVDLPKISHKVQIERQRRRLSVVELTHGTESSEGECSDTTRYWLASKTFPKPPHISCDKRARIDSRAVSVAIPLNGDEPHPGKLFAYLPVWDETGLPFIINADFLLTSSREGIHENEPWNEWLRDCIAQVYTEALLSCVRQRSLPVTDRAHAYASIPTNVHYAFLEPVVTEIQNTLREKACVLTSSNGKLATPQNCRLVSKEWRALLEEGGSVPSAVGTRFFLTHAAIEPPYEKALKTIGVRGLLQSDVVACLEDAGWVQRQSNDYDWLIGLYRSIQRFEPGALVGLRLLPAVALGETQTQYLCGRDHPVYFRPHGKESEALRRIPAWLRKAAPVFFLAKPFQRLLDKQEDCENLKDWMKKELSVYDFSAANYCVDVLDYLRANKDTISESALLEITCFLCEHAGENLEWESLPVILSDSRRMTVKEARELTWPGGENGTDVPVQALVIPENHRPDDGWQHIWRTEDDRRHFVALHPAYARFPERFFKRIGTKSYPGMASRHYSSATSCPDEYLKEQINKEKGAYVSRSSVDTWVLPNLPDPMTEDCARSLLAWLQELEPGPKEHQWINGDRCWYRLGLNSRAEYVYRRKEQRGFYDSPLLRFVRHASWLPTTKGLVVPSRAFLPEQETKETLGDSVPYVDGDYPSELLTFLGVSESVTVDTLLRRLKACLEDAVVDRELPERIYRALEARASSGNADALRQAFGDKPLIYIPSNSGDPRWVRADECVWDDASAVFGDDFAYLKTVYPKRREFFVDTLGVKLGVDAECYARHWISLQSRSRELDAELRSVVKRLYSEIRTALKNKPQPPWLSEFLEQARVHTESGGFEDPESVVVPDDGELKRLFLDQVAYAWIPESGSLADWTRFYEAFGVRRLSESVSVDLVGEPPMETVTGTRLLTPEAVQMIGVWLREREQNVYKRVLEDGTLRRLLEAREERSEEPLQASYRLRVGYKQFMKEETVYALWDENEGRLILASCEKTDPNKRASAKQLSRLILRGEKDEHGLAQWIELVLGETDTARIREENWSVPPEILELYSAPASQPGPAETVDDAAPQTQMAQDPLPRDQRAAAGAPDGQADGVQSTDGGLREPRGAERVADPCRGPQTGGTEPDRPEAPSPPKPMVVDRTSGPPQGRIDESAEEREGGTLHEPKTDEEHEPSFPDTPAPDPERRARKATERAAEAPEKDYEKRERRVRTSQSQVKAEAEPYLRDYYTDADDRMVCQICRQEMPFRGKDGKHYFERVEAFDLSKELRANYLALCPVCAAKYNEFVVHGENGARDALRQVFAADGALETPVQLGQEEAAIRFVEPHAIDLREAVRVETEETASIEQ